MVSHSPIVIFSKYSYPYEKKILIMVRTFSHKDEFLFSLW